MGGPDAYGDTASIDVVLQTVAVVLGPVEVSAEASPKGEAYHITAEDVVAYNRPVFSAYDILRKMRPDMLTSRTPEICEQPNAEPAVSKIIVNGRRIPIDKPISMTRHGSVIDADSIKRQVATILGEIRPEDVDEITFLDCLDNPRDNLVTRDALYVVLKRGVAYEYGRGSYVRGSSSSHRSAGPIAPSVRALRSQSRLIGVFDRLTAEPLAGVSITDQITALTVTTTATGTALVRRTSSGSALRFAKTGYRDTTIVTNADDSLPITALMTKKP